MPRCSDMPLQKESMQEWENAETCSLHLMSQTTGDLISTTNQRTKHMSVNLMDRLIIAALNQSSCMSQSLSHRLLVWILMSVWQFTASQNCSTLQLMNNNSVPEHLLWLQLSKWRAREQCVTTCLLMTSSRVSSVSVMSEQGRVKLQPEKSRAAQHSSLCFIWTSLSVKTPRFLMSSTNVCCVVTKPGVPTWERSSRRE